VGKRKEVRNADHAPTLGQPNGHGTNVRDPEPEARSENAEGSWKISPKLYGSAQAPRLLKMSTVLQREDGRSVVLFIDLRPRSGQEAGRPLQD
jgi:hypothetical protein